MQHLEGNGTPVLYIGRTFLKINNECSYSSAFLYRGGPNLPFDHVTGIKYFNQYTFFLLNERFVIL